MRPGRSKSDEEVEALFRHSFTRMRSLAFLMTGDSATAEEIAMEGFLRVFSRWRGVSEYENPEAYVRKVVVNLCRSRWRRVRVEARFRHAADRSSTEPWDSDRYERTDEVRAAVRELPAHQRACVVLRYYQDLSEGEIADALGCTTGAVKSQLSRARQRLARTLAMNTQGTTHV
jgi:RNA polymerase sigma-70 factor (sigma-E family)